MRPTTRVTWGIVCLLLGAALANAETITFEDDVIFTSDAEADKQLLIPQFDASLGTLTGVVVDVIHSGAAEPDADNDDAFKSAEVDARVVRAWQLSGPNSAYASANKTVAVTGVHLDPDDGDLALFDASAPDGHDFGSLGYADALPDTLLGVPGPLATYIGSGNLTYTVDVQTMVNALEWVVAPDVWQLQVQNPFLQVAVSVTYEYTPIPEPSTALLVTAALVGLATLFRRRDNA